VAAVPSADRMQPEQPGRVFRRPWLFAAVWLVYLAYPLAAAWRDPDPVQRVVGVAAVVAFAALYVVAFVRLRRARRTEKRVTTAECWWVLALLAALLVLAAPAAGAAVLSGTVYVVVVAVFGLPTRSGWLVVAVLIVVGEVLPRLVPGWQVDNFFGVQLLLSAFAAWGVTQFVERNAALAAAREGLAELAVAEERERMARDVHDILGHSLTVIAVKAELAGRLLEGTDGEPFPRAGRARAEVADIEQLARDALADVRATVGGYRSVSLAVELASARTALSAAGISADLPTAVDDVPGRWRELFGWAVREGVTNVVRHSGARHCSVRVGRDSVEVLDDGHGPADAESPSEGHGFRGLRERAAAAGARLVLGRSPEGGFALHVTVDDEARRAAL
jgi:two-component system sensor histidine kinase DesK